MAKIGTKNKTQRAAEAAVEGFRQDLGPFVVAAETTRMAMLFTDSTQPGNPIIFANDAFLELTGYAREEVLGQNFNFLMSHGTDGDALARLDAAFSSASRGGSEICYRRKDGSEFWSAIQINPVRDHSGSVVQHFASFVDLTYHKQEQSQSRMLIEELNHRVKNTLATVQSIVWQALRNNSDPAVIRDAIESRLFALSRSHDLLTRKNWEGVRLCDLIKNALEAFGVANGRSEHFAIAGKDIRVSPRIALALGVAFHELATNAVKYGAFSNAAGAVQISWTIEPLPNGKEIRLCWEEKGGPTVTLPSRKGFGSRVIEHGLAHELDGTVVLDYRTAGLICRINFPLTSGAYDG
ncbi:PAS domain-containing protein [Rhizobium sp. KVB221]|uniref:Blue-light-activated histidine kinase n=1 Tax=Rhizobium setariae TaxID=2801340 RepID=A0A937CNH1_9HYPH|nr:HWE histidine kinase domain-containing protein [Rhizobium setariae]MBL0375485.1 PAS domain-containing protein [Rhizobium setariae]